jgi:hypothetical protein
MVLSCGFALVKRENKLKNRLLVKITMLNPTAGLCCLSLREGVCILRKTRAGI